MNRIRLSSIISTPVILRNYALIRLSRLRGSVIGSFSADAKTLKSMEPCLHKDPRLSDDYRQHSSDILPRRSCDHLTEGYVSRSVTVYSTSMCAKGG